MTSERYFISDDTSAVFRNKQKSSMTHFLCVENALCNVVVDFLVCSLRSFSQITPFWSFFSIWFWHGHCLTITNRKGKLCLYKYNNVKILRCQPTDLLHKEKC